MADLSATFRRPFPAQIAAFRARLENLVPTARWDDLWHDQHDTAFVVAGAMKADLLADLGQAVDKAIAEGTGIEAFRREFRAIVEARGWHGWTGEGTKGGEAWRTRVIYKTNMRTSYAAGRMAQLIEGGFAWWIYRHGASLEPRQQHLSWDGLVLPPDHPFWLTHAPPNGWGCSCYVLGARTRAGAAAMGGKPGKVLPEGWDGVDARTGAPPGIDKGWAYAPGATQIARIREQARAKLPGLPPPVAAGLRGAIDAPRQWVPARTLADAAAQLVASGAAEAADLRGMRLSGANELLAGMVEVSARMGLRPLAWVGTPAAYPFGRQRVGRNAAAWFSPARNAICVRPGYTVPGAAAETFAPRPNPARQAAWGRALAQDWVVPEVRARAARMTRFDWAVVGDLRSLIAHELGHALHRGPHGPEIDAIQAEVWGGGWQHLMSAYGATIWSEYVAEAFALYTTGPVAEQYRIHPRLLALFERIDRWKS